MNRVVIIGGGIAGLTTAYYLKKCGVGITLIERKPTVGGCIRTDLKKERYLLEYGPNTFLSSSRAITDLARELKLDRQIVSNQKVSQKRYIYKKGEMHLVPAGPREFLKSHLMSGFGKLRVLLEPLVKSRSVGNESLAEFVSRRAGKELLNTIVDPFVSGVYAGDPYQLEVKSIFKRLVEIENTYGSVLKGLRHMKGELGGNNLLSFHWGMESLPARLFELMHKDIEIYSSVESISQLPEGKWEVTVDTYKEVIIGDAVVLATQASEAASLLMPVSQEIIAPLMNIPYVSLAVVHTAFRWAKVPIPLDGFGFLIPRTENIRILGSIWSSALFPNRAPNGEVLLTNFVGGAADPNAVDLEDHELLTHVLTGLEQTMNIRTEPSFYHIHRVSQAIPQYTVGHEDRLNEINKCLKKVPGIFLTGSYLNGISVSDTIEHAKNTSQEVCRYLAAKAPYKRRELQVSGDTNNVGIDFLHPEACGKPEGGVEEAD
jgi:oxygen-dependent protoporphyrinogen oxidase